MNKRIRQAARELKLLQEKFSQQELQEAVALLSQGDDEALAEFLSTQTAVAPDRGKTKRGAGNGLSNVVKDLRESEPERYELLSEFERMLRRDSILPTLEDVRRLGTSLSEEFQAGDSRQESIPRLMALLATQPLDVLQQRLGPLLDEGNGASRDDNAYQNLARFLISGARP